MKTDYKRIVLPAVKTFLQAAIAYLCTLGQTDLTSAAAVRGILLSCCAAGISALMNTDWQRLAEKGETE